MGAGRRRDLRLPAREQSNFNDYNVMHMSDMPDELNIGFIDSDAPPTGLGEVGTPIRDAGHRQRILSIDRKRLYHMPFTPERVCATLKV
jgi:isoquinoline 1-oxidoreductase subunit beta